MDTHSVDLHWVISVRLAHCRVPLEHNIAHQKSLYRSFFFLYQSLIHIPKIPTKNPLSNSFYCFQMFFFLLLLFISRTKHWLICIDVRARFYCVHIMAVAAAAVAAAQQLKCFVIRHSMRTLKINIKSRLDTSQSSFFFSFSLCFVVLCFVWYTLDAPLLLTPKRKMLKRDASHTHTRTHKSCPVRMACHVDKQPGSPAHDKRTPNAHMFFSFAQKSMMVLQFCRKKKKTKSVKQANEQANNKAKSLVIRAI